MSSFEPPFPELLRRFPVFRTSDVEEFQASLASKFGVTRAVVDDAAEFSSQARMIQLQDVGLVLGGSSTGVSIDFSESERLRVLYTLVGRGEVTVGDHSVPVDQQQACIVPPGRPQRCASTGNHAWLTLRLDPKSVERKLIALLGVRPKGKLEFAPATIRDDANVQNLFRLVKFFAEQLDSAKEAFPPILLRELEQSIMVAFLFANQHTFSALLRKRAEAPPDKVRRAEEYIEANWNSPVCVEDLAAVTGVGVRSLFRAFAQARGYSPIQFARLVRLRRARELLASGDPSISVTGVALQCGFENLGHFAGNYRKMFGELPSATISRARRIRA